jgi:hypothetical protein
MNSIKKVVRTFVPLVLGAFAAVGITTLPASASTTTCVANGFCGNQANFHDGLVFDVLHQVAKSNNKVIAYTNGVDKATDIIADHPSNGPTANLSAQIKEFKYAPNNVPSGLCLSDPGPGYGATDLLVLRPCNGSRFQTWTPIQNGDTSYYSWRNMASNQFITDNGLRVQLTDVKDGSVGNVNNNQPTGAESQLWTFVQAPATS